jgi:hypothetical protein
VNKYDINNSLYESILNGSKKNSARAPDISGFHVHLQKQNADEPTQIHAGCN